MPNEGYSNEIKTFGKQQKNHLVAKRETLVMIASFIELDIQIYHLIVSFTTHFGLHS